MSNAQQPVPVYCYDETGRYTGWEYADPDPLQPGEYLIPPNATLTPTPVYGPDEVAVYTDGIWTVKKDEARVKQYEKTQRMHRDRLLARSDWTQLPDAPLTHDEAQRWREYRHALRTVTTDPAWPDVAFPDPPEKEPIMQA